MYPAGEPPGEALADAWTWDAFLVAAEKCTKAGYPFGMPLSACSDAVNWVSAVFAGQGAQLVDAEGNITIKSDEMKAILGWFKKIVPSLPTSVFAWDNASNNKWLISGQGPLIMAPIPRCRRKATSTSRTATATPCVHKYTPDGKLLMSWGEPGTGEGEFNIVHKIGDYDRATVGDFAGFVAKYMGDGGAGRRSLLITANQPFGEWSKIFPDQAMTVAVVALKLVFSKFAEFQSARQSSPWL